MSTQQYINRVPKYPREWASVRAARPEDVSAIQNIYKEVYKGTYSYLEFTDADFLRQDMGCGRSIWHIVEDKVRQLICGCVSVTVDPSNMSGYSRGMMLRPAWQGFGGTARIFGTALQNTFDWCGGRLRIVWGEARSANIKPQAVAESIGMMPMAVLPGKDIFFQRRETAVIMAIYLPIAWHARDSHVFLVRQLLPLYRHMQSRFKPMALDMVEIDGRTLLSGTMTRLQAQTIVQVSSADVQYGYVQHQFHVPEAGSSLSIVVNKQCLNAEHLELNCTEADMAQTLLRSAIEFLEGNGVQYAEGKCPANRPDLQTAFLSVGMKPLGYLPAWYKDPASGLFVDQIVFGWKGRSNMPGSSALSSTAQALSGAIMGA